MLCTLKGYFHIHLLKFLCVHLKSQFKMCTHQQDFVPSQQFWKLIMVQHATHTGVMWKLKVSPLQASTSFNIGPPTFHGYCAVDPLCV